uniref:Uncharacterized protein n=1 Tax=Arundo donax TaxID=35708 RepID=A0A0A9GDW9_ARUDO
MSHSPRRCSSRR